MHLPVMIHHFLQSHKQSNLKANAEPDIAENLHTDKKEEDEEEGEGDDGEKEEVAIGKERMSRIQSMFSGEKKNMEEDGVLTSPSCTDFNELLDEGWILCFAKKQPFLKNHYPPQNPLLSVPGLVSANLHRFTSGNLRRTSQDCGSPRRTSVDTVGIDKKHIEAVASKFEGSANSKEPLEPLAKGKSMRLRGAEDVFQHSKILMPSTQDLRNDCLHRQGRVHGLCEV